MAASHSHQCNRPAPRRGARGAGGARRRPARPPPELTTRWRGGAAEGHLQGGHGREPGDAGGWARVKVALFFLYSTLPGQATVGLRHLRLWKKRKEFLDFQSPPIVGSTGLPHHNQVPPILVQDRERLSPDTGCPQCDHIPLSSALPFHHPLCQFARDVCCYDPVSLHRRGIANHDDNNKLPTFNTLTPASKDASRWKTAVSTVPRQVPLMSQPRDQYIQEQDHWSTLLMDISWEWGSMQTTNY